MATTGIVISDNLNFFWGGTKVNHVTSTSFSGTVNGIPTTSNDSAGFETMEPGNISGTMELTFHCAYDATQGVDEMATDWLAKTKRIALLSTAVTGDTTISAAVAYISSFNMSGGNQQPVSVSCSIQISGTIAKGAVS